MRVLGIPIDTPQAIVTRAVNDIQTIEQLLRSVPGQIDRGLSLGQELVDIGHRILVIAERLEQKAERMDQLGQQLDHKASQLLMLGEDMRNLGGKIDATGGQIVDQAQQVVSTASEVITMLPALERALELASPLEGAIDRFGRMVDRFPGASTSRRRGGSDDA
jgi:hypothetical protein